MRRGARRASAGRGVGPVSSLVSSFVRTELDFLCVQICLSARSAGCLRLGSFAETQSQLPVKKEAVSGSVRSMPMSRNPSDRHTA